ncbi:MAG: hypothetical protein WDO68_10650 [Gammaproteobacteria bacterium]
MRISDDRFDRDLGRIRLAWRMIGHGARTQTIQRWSGLSRYRIQSLYRDYGAGAGSLAEPRHRGRSPGQVTFFWQSAQLRCEAAILAGFFRLFGPAPLTPADSAKESLPGLVSGDQLCESYERFRSLAPESQISIEHAVLLLLELARGVELRVDRCAECETALVLIDVLAAGTPSMPPLRAPCEYSGWRSRDIDEPGQRGFRQLIRSDGAGSAGQSLLRAAASQA